MKNFGITLFTIVGSITMLALSHLAFAQETAVPISVVPPSSEEVAEDIASQIDDVSDAGTVTITLPKEDASRLLEQLYTNPDNPVLPAVTQELYRQTLEDKIASDIEVTEYYLEYADDLSYFLESIIKVIIALKIIGAGLFVFWLIMLVHAINNPIRNKVTWVILLIFLNIIGAIAYLISVFLPMEKEARAKRKEKDDIKKAKSLAKIATSQSRSKTSAVKKPSSKRKPGRPRKS